MELPPNQQRVRRDRWPVVGERFPKKGDSPWQIVITGHVFQERSVSLQALRSMDAIEQTIDVHCVTRWSKPRMQFRGVPLAALIRGAHGTPLWTPEARFVSFIARSDRGHSTSLPLADIMKLDPLIALEADGHPLTTEHGGPMRMVVPGKYFYKSVKWIERIEFLAADRLGYWEAEAGYHNGADPWKEQRYIAAAIGKQETRQLIQSRDFSHRDLLGLNVQSHNLAGLQAEQALLRNANFRGCDLHRASFRSANLSNAHLDFANLQEASFVDADLEGACLAGADLRGADLRGASLFGASFCRFAADDPVDTAFLDATTIMEIDSLRALTDEQRDWVETQLRGSS